MKMWIFYHGNVLIPVLTIIRLPFTLLLAFLSILTTVIKWGDAPFAYLQRGLMQMDYDRFRAAHPTTEE